MIAAALARGDQLRGEWVIMFRGNNAPGGPLVGATSGAPVVLAVIGSHWRNNGPRGSYSLDNARTERE